MQSSLVCKELQDSVRVVVAVANWTAGWTLEQTRPHPSSHDDDFYEGRWRLRWWWWNQEYWRTTIVNIATILDHADSRLKTCIGYVFLKVHLWNWRARPRRWVVVGQFKEDSWRDFERNCQFRIEMRENSSPSPKPSTKKCQLELRREIILMHAAPFCLLVVWKVEEKQELSFLSFFSFVFFLLLSF